jgi:hypothetical protein
MKSIRLNQAIRADMVKSMREQYDQNNPPPSTQEQRNAAEGQVAEFLWRKFLGKWKDPINAVPERLLYMTNSVKVAIEGGSMESVGVYDGLGERYALPAIPSSGYGSSPIGVISREEFDQVMAPFRDMCDRFQKWDQEKHELISEAEMILESIQTTKQLHEVWPEGCAYLPPFAADPSLGMQVPALHTSRLNKFLGLEGTTPPATEKE